MNLTLNLKTTSQSARVHVAGDLEYGSAAELVDMVSPLLAEQSTLQNLHLDCSELTFCDSAGLSALLTIRNLTTRAGVALHLDNRPVHLERVLEITGLLDHLTAPCDADDEADGVDVSDDTGTVGRRMKRSD